MVDEVENRERKARVKTEMKQEEGGTQDGEDLRGANKAKRGNALHIPIFLVWQLLCGSGSYKGSK